MSARKLGAAIVGKGARPTERQSGPFAVTRRGRHPAAETGGLINVNPGHDSQGFVVLAGIAAEIGVERSVAGVDGEDEVGAAVLVLPLPDVTDVNAEATKHKPGCSKEASRSEAH